MISETHFPLCLIKGQSLRRLFSRCELWCFQVDAFFFHTLVLLTWCDLLFTVNYHEMLIVFPEAKILAADSGGGLFAPHTYLVKIWKKPRCISGDNVLPLSRTNSHFQSCQPFPVPAPNPAASPSITGGGETHGEGEQLSSLSTLTERITRCSC